MAAEKPPGPLSYLRKLTSDRVENVTSLVSGFLGTVACFLEVQELKEGCCLSQFALELCLAVSYRSPTSPFS